MLKESFYDLVEVTGVIVDRLRGRFRIVAMIQV